MPYTIEWLVEDRVLGVSIAGDITLAELQEVSPAIVRHCDNGIAPVHTLIDLRHLGAYPRNLTELAGAFKTPPSANLNWIVLITNNQMIRFFTSVVVQLSGKHVTAFTDYPAALKFLAQRDHSLEVGAAIQRFSSSE